MVVTKNRCFITRIFRIQYEVFDFSSLNFESNLCRWALKIAGEALTGSYPDILFVFFGANDAAIPQVNFDNLSLDLYCLKNYSKSGSSTCSTLGIPT